MSLYLSDAVIIRRKLMVATSDSSSRSLNPC